MLHKITTFADRHNMFAYTCVTVAVSGGADSMCLLDALSRIGQKRGFTVNAAHFNHGVRGKASDSDEAFVRDWCARRGVALTVGAAAGLPSNESRLRAERYAFFASLDTPAIATAHNADDNAETLLMRFHGIPPLSRIQSGKLRMENSSQSDTLHSPLSTLNCIRPLLSCTRAEIERYLLNFGVPHIEDASNADTRYLRNNVRHNIMPLLRGTNPQFAKHALYLTEKLRQFDEITEQSAAAFLLAEQFDVSRSFSRKNFNALHYAIAEKAVKLAARMGGTEIFMEQSESIIRLSKMCASGKTIVLPNGVNAKIAKKNIEFTKD